MKNLQLIILFVLFAGQVIAQTIPTPGAEQTTPIALTNATIHIGNGQVIDNGTILFENGKIVGVGESISLPAKVQTIDYTGKHIYPGLIAIDTRLGIAEVEALRQTRDFDEVGPLNANVRSLIAYNTDSRVTPTVRSNGVLLAQVAPTGGRISGTSSVMQLDAWNWEDAAVNADDGVYLNWPNAYRRTGWWAEPGGIERSKDYSNQLSEMKAYFAEAHSYAKQSLDTKNLRFEGMRGLFNGSKKLFIRVNGAQEIISAVRFAQDFGIKPVIVGGSDSHLVADFLVENDVPVVLNALHRTPNYEDEAIFNPYEMPKQLKDKGVTFALTYADFWQVRNLPFQAGQAVAYGLSKEDALRAITLDAAEVLGIADKMGSIEVGKDATIVVSEGDILDMMSSNVIDAYVQGRKMSLGNKQKDLYIKFSDKYGHDYEKP